MAVIIIGTTGATWGLTAETGVIVQTVTNKTSREKNLVRNEAGDVALGSFYNPLRTISISAVIVGTSGIAAAAPGVSLTVANGGSSNGGPTGGIYTDDVETAGGNTEFKKCTVNATQYQFA